MIIKLKELRTEYGISQNELAQQLNTSQRNISNWESGASEPDFETLKKICTFFDTSADYVLGLDTEHDTATPTLSPTDKSIIAIIKNLNNDKKIALLNFLRATYNV